MFAAILAKFIDNFTKIHGIHQHLQRCAEIVKIREILAEKVCISIATPPPFGVDSADSRSAQVDFVPLPREGHSACQGRRLRLFQFQVRADFVSIFSILIFRKTIFWKTQQLAKS